MNGRHVNKSEEFARISDRTLRESLRQAVDRASDVDFAFFAALQDAQGVVHCFDAALPALISQFLCRCAYFAFPRSPAPARSASVGDERFDGIVDAPLRGAMECAFTRAKKLNLSFFFDLWIASLGGAEEHHFCSASCLPLEIAEHLHLSFRLATAASLWNGEPSAGPKPWWQVGLIN